MKSEEDEKGSVDPATNPEHSKEILKHLTIIASYHIERGLSDFNTWGEKMIDDFGQYVRPYLSSAWKEAEHILEPRNTINEENILNENPSRQMIVKYYGKKTLLILLWIFLYFSLFLGVSEVIYKILPYFFVNVLEHWGNGENESNIIYTISAVFSFICLYTIYMGYKYYREGHWGEGLPILGKRLIRADVDRDELIDNLENIFHLIDKLDKIKGNNKNFSYDELQKMKNKLSDVIKLKNQQRKKQI